MDSGSFAGTADSAEGSFMGTTGLSLGERSCGFSEIGSFSKLGSELLLELLSETIAADLLGLTLAPCKITEQRKKWNQAILLFYPRILRTVKTVTDLQCSNGLHFITDRDSARFARCFLG